MKRPRFTDYRKHFKEVKFTLIVVLIITFGGAKKDKSNCLKIWQKIRCISKAKIAPQKSILDRMPINYGGAEWQRTVAIHNSRMND